MTERLREILAVFDDDEIEAEADRRGLIDSDADDEYEAEPEFGDVDMDDFRTLADAFHLGRPDEAMRIARSMAERATGRILL